MPWPRRVDGAAPPRMVNVNEGLRLARRAGAPRVATIHIGSIDANRAQSGEGWGLGRRSCRPGSVEAQEGLRPSCFFAVIAPQSC
jgi:hypothetical protein